MFATALLATCPQIDADGGSSKYLASVAVVTAVEYDERSSSH
jgi:hypothetical protein